MFFGPPPYPATGSATVYIMDSRAMLICLIFPVFLRMVTILFCALKYFFSTDHHSLTCSDFFQDANINVEPIITLLAMQ